MERAYIASVTHRMLSIEKGNTNNIGRLLEPNSSVNRVRQLRL
jgi:hypothetical protein